MSLFRPSVRHCLWPAMPPAAATLALGLCALAGAGSAHAAPPAKATAQRSPLLTGTVTDTVSGTPVTGATVYVYTAAPRTGTSPFCPSCYPDCGRRQATSARGAFRIPVSARSLIFRLLIVRDGYEPAFADAFDPLSLKPHHITLKKRPGGTEDARRLITGRVLDASGQPVVGATVEPFGKKIPNGAMYGTIPGVEPLAITDTRGIFRFHSDTPDSILFAKVQARGLAPLLVSDLRPARPTPQEIHLSAGTTVAGTVQSANGQKLPRNVVVEVVHADRSAQNFVGWFDIGCNEDGTFSLPNLPAGKDYLVCVRMDSLNGTGLAAARQTVTTGKDGTTADGITLRLQPAATLTGNVTLSDGKPIPAGTRILLSRVGTWDVQDALLGANGNFTFRNMPQGDNVSLFVRVPGYHFAPDTPMRREESGNYWLTMPPNTPTMNASVSLVPDTPRPPKS